MATTVLSKDAIITLNSADITDFVSNDEFTHMADAIDVTTYGNDSHRFVGGLFNGSLTIGGVYDTTSSGPHDVIRPLVGTVVELVYQPEGAGSGLPGVTVDVLVQDYKESGQFAEIRRWSATLQFDGDAAFANQSS